MECPLSFSQHFRQTTISSQRSFPYLDIAQAYQTITSADLAGSCQKRTGDELTFFATVGKVCYKDEIYGGEHDAIVPIELWEKVQKQLKHNGRTGGIMVRNKFFCSTDWFVVSAATVP